MRIEAYCHTCLRPVDFIDVSQEAITNAYIIRVRCHGVTDTKKLSPLQVHPGTVLDFFRPDITEEAQLEAAVDRFAEEMKARLLHIKETRNWEGWNNPVNAEDMARRMVTNAAKGLANRVEEKDFIDTANLAMFLWHLEFNKKGPQ